MASTTEFDGSRVKYASLWKVESVDGGEGNTKIICEVISNHDSEDEIDADSRVGVEATQSEADSKENKLEIEPLTDDGATAIKEVDSDDDRVCSHGHWVEYQQAYFEPTKEAISLGPKALRNLYGTEHLGILDLELELEGDPIPCNYHERNMYCTSSTGGERFKVNPSVKEITTLFLMEDAKTENDLSPCPWFEAVLEPSVCIYPTTKFYHTDSEGRGYMLKDVSIRASDLDYLQFLNVTEGSSKKMLRTTAEVTVAPLFEDEHRTFAFENAKCRFDSTILSMSFTHLAPVGKRPAITSWPAVFQISTSKASEAPDLGVAEVCSGLNPVIMRRVVDGNTQSGLMNVSGLDKGSRGGRHNEFKGYLQWYSYENGRPPIKEQSD